MPTDYMWYVGGVKGKPRPRAKVMGSMPSIYPDPSGVKYEKLLRTMYEAQGCGKHDGPVSVTILYGRQMPKSRPKRMEFEDDTYKPDVDNVAKAVLDALNGVAYDDDKQVVSLSVHKVPRIRGRDEMMFVSVSDVTDEHRKVVSEIWRSMVSSFTR